MSGKDFLTLLLVNYGFTKKIEIKTYKGDDIYFQGYDIHAENDEGECFDECNCEGLMFNITYIINWMRDHGIDTTFT